jgi:hypothetical protein
MDIKMGFHKITPYYYTGRHEPGAEAQFLVNKKAFGKLCDRNRAILKRAMRLAATALCQVLPSQQRSVGDDEKRVPPHHGPYLRQTDPRRTPQDQRPAHRKIQCRKPPLQGDCAIPTSTCAKPAPGRSFPTWTISGSSRRFPRSEAAASLFAARQGI